VHRQDPLLQAQGTLQDRVRADERKSYVVLVTPRVITQDVRPQMSTPHVGPFQSIHSVRIGALSPRVNVTIGRIEVKAVHAPPAVQQSREAPPEHLALEDFLKKKRNRNE
jgi:hypothetical protein